VQVAQGLEGRLRGIGSLLGLGGEGRWPQQKAIVSDMATADAMFIDVCALPASTINSLGLDVTTVYHVQAILGMATIIYVSAKY